MRVHTPWLALFSSPALWWICGQQAFRAAGYVFFTSWFATYLQETRGVSIARSGFLNMLPLLAVVAAGMLGGALSDRLLKRTGQPRCRAPVDEHVEPVGVRRLDFLGAGAR